jgi:two-component system, LuxR family, sensor kinase FixL
MTSWLSTGTSWGRRRHRDDRCRELDGSPLSSVVIAVMKAKDDGGAGERRSGSLRTRARPRRMGHRLLDEPDLRYTPMRPGLQPVIWEMSAQSRPPVAMVRYGFAILLVLIGVGLALLLEPFGLEKFLLLTPAAVAAWYVGIGPAVLALLLSTLALAYFFMPPLYSFAVRPDRVPYLVAFSVFGLLTSWLAVSLRRAEQSLARARDEFQVKVQERTAELQRSNDQLRDEIAERKRTEEEARRQAALLSLAHDAILVRDLESRVVFWNPGAEETYGWTAEEAIGSVTHELLQTRFPISLDAVDAALREQGGWGGELTHITRGGAAIVVASRQSMQRDERGAPVAILEINRDITDRTRAEKALRTAEAELAHVTRVTTLGEVTASFAHEVNQPLAAIVNNANACLTLLVDERPDLDEVRAALADITSDAERASAIIERVRALAKRSSPEKVPLRLEDVVEDVVALVATEAAARRVTIRTEVAPDLPVVLGDRVQLQQVLLNLVINGMDAMGTVDERGRLLEIRGRQDVQSESLAATISVQDQGIGLNAAQMGRLFEAFYTTKPHGMGMGLAISRSIIEMHSGRLWAEANQGPGATFSFSVPAAVSPVPSA